MISTIYYFETNSLFYFCFLLVFYRKKDNVFALTLINLACVKKFVGTDGVVFSLKWSCDEYTVYIWPCSKEIK